LYKGFPWFIGWFWPIRIDFYNYYQWRFCAIDVTIVSDGNKTNVTPDWPEWSDQPMKMLYTFGAHINTACTHFTVTFLSWRSGLFLYGAKLLRGERSEGFGSPCSLCGRLYTVLVLSKLKNKYNRTATATQRFKILLKLILSTKERGP